MQSVKKCFILFVKRLLSYMYYGKHVVIYFFTLASVIITKHFPEDR